VATETIDNHENLIALPCYRWHHVVVVPPGHALLDAPKLTLEALAAHPIITYDSAFTGRSTINQAFAKKGLTPNIVLSAIDSDVIKTYIELGLGVGILNSIAFEELRDRHLRKIDAGHLFAERTTFLALREGAYLRSFAYDFIEMFTPALDRASVDRALKRDR
jgi:DNA-binding transcriptional LysR family regulator